MSIMRIIVFECDDCGEELNTETEDWNEAIEQMRTEEWRAVKSYDEWEHYCPDCKADH